jgi:hypothetical protein
MWQRIQTVFLAIVILASVFTIFLPLWEYDAPTGQHHELYALHYTVVDNGVKTTQYFPYAITAMLAIASATIAFISIGKYKNRMLQMKLGALNSFFIAGTILAAVILSNQFIKSFQGGNYGAGLWVPGIAVVCNFLANRFVRRDEKIVRDSQRLR